MAGDLTSWNHPAGFTISQPVDGARHITQVTSSVSGAAYPTTLAFGGGPNSSIEYTAWGAVSQLENGCAGSGCTNIQETYFYNKRMQMAVAELGTSTSHSADACREYSFYEGAGASVCSETPSAWPTGNNNNGNVAGYDYVDNANSTLSHAAVYHYDAVNRLISAAATGSATYSQTYTYNGDGSNNLFGNLSCSPAGPGCAAFTYSATTNRITNTGYSYDGAGNVIGDGTYTYQWDAESHLTAVYQSGNVVSLNTYNALGQRVEDIAQASTTDEAYGADGELLGRFTGDSNARSFVPFGGGLLAEYFCGGMIFDHPDELGSLTASTDCTGNTVNEKMFYPCGESWTGAAMPNLGAHQVFGKLPDYDVEIDQYNTANRHYSPMGRWMSPDPGGVKMVILEDPQTWNMYAYVRNNPPTVTDPTGLGGPQPAATGAAYVEEMNQYLYSDYNAFQAPPPPPEPLPTPPPPGPAAQTVTVTVQQVSSAQPFGHATVSVGGDKPVGLVPNSDAAASAAATTEAVIHLPISVAGHVSDDNRKSVAQAKIKVTPDQAKKMREIIQKAEHTPQRYDPAYRNCATFVEEVLRGGGVSVHDDMTPGGLVQDLQRQKQ